jgi:CRP-like cAMP-binding protein
LATSLEIEPRQPANRTENSGKLIRNTILQAIPESEFSLLQSHLQTVRLEHEQVLFQPNQAIEYCYFPNSGMVSMVVVTSEGSSVEVGVMGFEGFVGLPVAFGFETSPLQAIIQISPAEAVRIKADVVRRLIGSVPELKVQLDRFAVIQGAIVGQLAACNRVHELEQRLARWLAMSHDRVQTDTMNLTQEFLSEMLGTARPSVTLAAGALQRKQAIEYARGAIKVINRQLLVDSACGCYGVIRQYNAALGLEG